MPRRVSLPSADALFRGEPEKTVAVRAVPDQPEPTEPTESAQTAAAPDATGRRRPSGRVRHDEKMTVYVTSDELLEIEHARLSLRRTLGVAVDRGRLVREAVALVLADLEQRGEDSALVHRLNEG